MHLLETDSNLLVDRTQAILETLLLRRVSSNTTSRAYRILRGEKLLEPDSLETYFQKVLTTPTSSKLLRVVVDGKPLHPADYCELLGDGSLLTLPQKIAEYQRSGATLSLRSWPTVPSPLTPYLEGLTKTKAWEDVWANFYFTPAACSGFSMHWDTHLVVVVQLRGSKAWRVAQQSSIECPRRYEDQYREGMEEKMHEGVLEIDDVVLQAGDVLVLKPGCLHSARANEADSFHVSIALQPFTVASLLTEALKNLQDETRAEAHRTDALLGGERVALGKLLGTYTTSNPAEMAHTIEDFYGAISKMFKHQGFVVGDGR